jgi:hypothetical protein
MKKVTWVFVIMIFGFCFSQPVFAKDSESPDEQKKMTGEKVVDPWPNFELDLGIALTTLNSSVSFGSTSSGLGIQVDTEDALNIDSSTLVFFGGGYYRFGSTRRHRFDFSYTSYNRDGTAVLGTNIPIFNVIFPQGDTVNTEFDFDILRAGYSYSLLKDDRMDIGIGAGLYVMPISFSMNSSTLGVYSNSITAPLPFLTLRGDFALTPKLFLKAKSDLFYLKYNGFTGSILAGGVALEYNFWKNVGLGLGFNNFQVEVDGDGDSNYPNVDFSGQINFEYQGLLLYTKIYF